MSQRIMGQKYLARALAEYGLDHVFMVPTSFTYTSAEMDRLGLTVVMTHGEKAAAYMADGYARLRRAPGLCHAQAIGGANLAAGLRDAYMAGSPVMALTGGAEPATAYRNLYQEIDDFPMFRSVTKASRQIHDAKRLPDMLRQLFRDATSGAPRPVHLEVAGLTGGLLETEIEVNESEVISEPTFATVPAQRIVPSDEAMHAALVRLVRAERPIMIIGGGGVWSDAGPQISALARRLGIPVATSMNAKGILDEHDSLAVGVVGASSRASANQAVMAADLVFFVGSHTGSQVTDGWRLPAAGTEVIQLDIDPSELGRNYPNRVSLHGDAEATLARMVALSGIGPDRSAWLNTVSEYVTEWRRANDLMLSSTQRPLRPERICAEITRALPADGVLVVDTGHTGIWAASMVDLQPGQRFLRSAGSLGWAFPASIGAQCAAPDRRVVCFTGDGGLYYHLAELETAARYGIPVVIVVNDNRSLSQDIEPYRVAYEGEHTDAGDRLWRLNDVDLATIATSMGCVGRRVDSPDDLTAALAEAVADRRPTLIDAVSEISAFPEPPYGGQSFYQPATAATR